MVTKLEKIRNELNKARSKSKHWEQRVKDLEKRYIEEENTQIHEMVHAANMTPEELAELLKKLSESTPQTSHVELEDKLNG